jgi:hypothetical protein
MGEANHGGGISIACVLIAPPDFHRGAVGQLPPAATRRSLSATNSSK